MSALGHLVQQLPQRPAHVLPTHQDGEWLLDGAWGVSRERAGQESDSKQRNGGEQGKEGGNGGQGRVATSELSKDSGLLSS